MSNLVSLFCPRPPRLLSRWTWAAFAGVALGLIVGEIAYLQRRREKQAAAAADGVVAAHVEAAEAQAARGNWDEAIGHLEEALATEQAPTRERARPLLRQARQGQARALLDAARAAIGARDVPRAFTLLHAYRAHPGATDPAQATRLEEELRRAAAGDAAADRLARMTEDELARFAAHGEVRETEKITDPGVRLIFLDALWQKLPREQARRAAARRAARAAAARQEARLRATPAFRRLVAFVAESRTRLRDLKETAGEQAEAMEHFFEQTGVRDPGERERVRKELRDGDDAAALLAAVRRKGEQAKRAFRRSGGVAPRDADVFDRLVDREVDALRQEAKARE